MADPKPVPAVPLVGFAAYSGTGKTTLLTKLIAIFKSQGLRVGIVKHAHHTFEIDYPGKDSYELRQAGANQVLIGSKKRWALMVEMDEDQDHPLEHHVSHLLTEHLDLILVEGFKPLAIPKIELHRPSLGKPLLFPEDDSIIAIACDGVLPVSTSLPVMDLNQTDAIAQFIIDRFLSGQQNSSVSLIK